MNVELKKYLSRPAEIIAPLLLGCVLEREVDGKIIRVKIVETEAYSQLDAASHSYKGRTPRTDVMFGPAGYLYVYFTYGMHYCCNIVTGKEGEGSAVLIRAAEPLEGEQYMHELRKHQGIDLSNGPAKLCQALQIDKQMNGHNLSQKPLKLHIQPPLNMSDITQTIRIGITQAKDIPWRFYITNNKYVSKP